MVSKLGFRAMRRDAQTLDFSGWPMIVRADMSNDVAYALCEAIEKRKYAIPTDNYKPLDIAQSMPDVPSILACWAAGRPRRCLFVTLD